MTGRRVTIAKRDLPFLGAFVKFPKATISFLMSVSVHPSLSMEELGYHWKDFHEIWCLSIFLKSVEKIQVSLQSYQNNCTVHEDLCTLVIISHSYLLIIRNILDITCRETHV
jgi:hypothetical protein